MSSDSEDSDHSSTLETSSETDYTYFASLDFFRHRGQFLILLSRDPGSFANILRRLHEKRDNSRFALLSSLVTTLSKCLEEDVTSPPPEFHALMHSGMLVLLVDILTEEGTYPMGSDPEVIIFRTSLSSICNLRALFRTLGLRLTIAICRAKSSST